MTNQSEEIRDFIKDNPGASTEQVVKGTGWNRHLVEMALKLMTQSAVIQEVGRTDWDDPKFELIVREPKGLQEALREIKGTTENMIEKINQDLSLSSPSGLFRTGLLIGDCGFIRQATKAEADFNRLMVLTQKSAKELKAFLEQSHYSAKELGDYIATYGKFPGGVGRMEEQQEYLVNPWTSGLQPLKSFAEAFSEVFPQEQYTFVVTVPGNEHLTVKAADCYTDEGSLVFEDDNDVTIMIIAPGHWVKVQRVEDDQNA